MAAEPTGRLRSLLAKRDAALDTVLDLMDELYEADLQDAIKRAQQRQLDKRVPENGKGDA